MSLVITYYLLIMSPVPTLSLKTQMWTVEIAVNSSMSDGSVFDNNVVLVFDMLQIHISYMVVFKATFMWLI